MKKKITLGVDGLDKMIGGGIPEGNQIVLVGGPGAGKTLSGFEFLYKNALQGENGLYVSFEENTENIINNVKDTFAEFKEIDGLLQAKKIVINGENVSGYGSGVKEYGERRYEFSKIVAEIASLIRASSASRVVVDSLSVFKSLLNDELEYRSLSLSLISMLRGAGVTALFILELEEDNPNTYVYPKEFFLYDGIIMLRSPIGSGKRIPSIEIIKMRGSPHSYSTMPYKITSSGIKILNVGMADE